MLVPKSLLTYLLSKYLLFIYYVPDSVLVIKDTKRISYLQVCFYINQCLNISLETYPSLLTYLRSRFPTNYTFSFINSLTRSSLLSNQPHLFSFIFILVSNGLIIASILESLILYSFFLGIIESTERDFKCHLMHVQLILNTFHDGESIQYICLRNAY